jgi:hypothetical protein
MSLALIIIGCYLCLVAVLLAFALACGKAASTADDQMDRAIEIEHEARAAEAVSPSRARPTTNQREAGRATEPLLTPEAATSPSAAPRPYPPAAPAPAAPAPAATVT